MNLSLSDFDYTYPDELVAQRPLAQRDASRMMVVDRKARAWRHRCVTDLREELRAGDLLVVNDTRVAPARLFGVRAGGGPVEVLAVEPAPGGTARGGPWRCLLRNARRIREGERMVFGNVPATAARRDGLFVLLTFDDDGLARAMEATGVPPLPPYIRREGYAAYTREDRERYQTVYANPPGSAAAPTAGLHLSEPLLAELAARGVLLAPITLHVGIDTFAPVRAHELQHHRMHGERVEIPAATAAAVAAAKAEGRRVIAVGTTSVRALESAARGRAPRAGSFTTRLFIRPGFRFRVVDAMLTNFHQPRSTLLLLVAAFAGREFLLDCYAEAIRERYRLFSFGDCMLLR